MRIARRRQYINKVRREGAKGRPVKRNIPVAGNETVSKEKHTYMLAIAAICFALITAVMAGSRAKAGAPEAEGYYKYYTSVSVEYGDTLESLAAKYNNRSVKSDSEYISEICRINSLDNKDKIKSGKSLVLPYYSETFIR